MGVAGAAAAVTAVVAVAGVAMQASAQADAASAQKKAANYQAQVAENNKILAEQNAQRSREAAQRATAAGEQQSERAQLQSTAREGAILAAEGSSGVDVNSGSNVDVRADQRSLDLLDAQTIRYNAAQKAYGYQVEATNADQQAGSYGAQAGLDRATGTNAQIAGDTAAGGSLLSGVSSVGSKYAAWQQQNNKMDGSTVTADASSAAGNSAGDFATADIA